MAAAAFLYGFDISRPPPEQVSARVLLSGIHFYQEHLRAPVRDGMNVRCRFEPSCSRYSAATIERYGGGKGLVRAAWRILRCGPWTPKGTVDPP